MLTTANEEAAAPEGRLGNLRRDPGRTLPCPEDVLPWGCAREVGGPEAVDQSGSLLQAGIGPGRTPAFLGCRREVQPALDVPSGCRSFVYFVEVNLFERLSWS